MAKNKKEKKAGKASGEEVIKDEAYFEAKEKAKKGKEVEETEEEVEE